jgi:Rap1a immunity proteins
MATKHKTAHGHFFAGLVLSMASLLLVMPARAGANVQEMYQNCLSKGDNVRQAICAGFVGGVAEQMEYNGAILARMNKTDELLPTRLIMVTMSACYGDVSYGALIQAFVNWAAKHPEKWSDTAQRGVMEAARETWPCLP